MRSVLLATGCALACATAAPTADAVFTNIIIGSTYTITLRVGTPSAGVVDEVAFDITGNNAGLTPLPVTNPASVIVQVGTDRVLLSAPDARLTVDSSAGLACIAGSGCGTTIIPFSTISWTVSDATSPAAGDIQNGSFTGAAGQQIAAFSSNSGIITARQMTNTLTFTYANSTIYPGGRYRGRVVFTATLI